MVLKAIVKLSHYPMGYSNYLNCYLTAQSLHTIFLEAFAGPMAVEMTVVGMVAEVAVEVDLVF